MENTKIPVGCVIVTMSIFKITVFCKLSKENSSESSNHECWGVDLLHTGMGLSQESDFGN